MSFKQYSPAIDTATVSGVQFFADSNGIVLKEGSVQFLVTKRKTVMTEKGKKWLVAALALSGLGLVLTVICSYCVLYVIEDISKTLSDKLTTSDTVIDYGESNVVMRPHWIAEIGQYETIVSLKKVPYGRRPVYSHKEPTITTGSVQIVGYNSPNGFQFFIKPEPGAIPPHLTTAPIEVERN